MALLSVRWRGSVSSIIRPKKPGLVDPQRNVGVDVPSLVGALHEWMRDVAILRRLRLRREVLANLDRSVEGALKDDCQNVDEFWLRRHVLLFLDKRWVRQRIAMQHSVRRGVPYRDVLKELEDWRGECREFCRDH